MSVPLPPLPQEFALRAREFYTENLPPVVPKPAATVVLLRDASGGGIEAYLLRRVMTMAFAAGMYAFPGGSVDPRDSAPAGGWIGAGLAEWAGALSAEDPLAAALVCAAVRETFEESGVLLAGPSADEVVADTRADEWEADRLALLDRSQSLSGLLARRGLHLRADLLRPWAHWITPEFEERRYDTRFFVAALPEGQRTRDVGGEADRVVWMAPGEAVQRCLDGELGMLPPTIVTLTELAEFDSVGDVLAADRGAELYPKTPRVQLAMAGVRLLMPGDPDFETGGPSGYPGNAGYPGTAL
jgi:8-oxo-dGTP pyrophosphatase MutT (NUDIX family)